MPASDISIGTPRVATSGFFLAAGIGLGAWAACLPALMRLANLDEAQVGIVLLCFALGAIVAMTNVGRLVPIFGTATLCLVGAVIFGAMLAAAPHLASLWPLACLVAVGGAAFGNLDVSMNTEAAHLERLSGRHIMSSFHALYSVGSLAGAGICGQILRSGGDVFACLGIAGAVVVAVSILCWWWAPGPEVPADGDDLPPKATARLDPFQKRRLFLLGIVAFLALFGEGAIIDWIAIYLVDTIGTPESTGAFAFAVFAGTMAFGRAVGDIVTRLAGPSRVLGFGAVAVAAGFGCVLAVSWLPVILVGLAVCGLGVANVVPMIFSAAGRIGGDAAGAAMSRVATMGYAGLLLGPPFIGFLAQATSLAASLSSIVVAMLVVAAGATLVRPRPAKLEGQRAAV